MTTLDSRAAALRRVTALVGGVLLGLGVALLFAPKPWQWWWGLIVILLAAYQLVIAANAHRLQRWWDSRRPG